MTRAVVFLDVDGVLATGPSISAAKLGALGVYDSATPERKAECMDRRCVERLNEITRATGAVIVVSSCWRYSSDHVATLRAAGVEAEIIGHTPKGVVEPGRTLAISAERGQEIGAWRIANEHDGPFVILDDGCDMGNYRRHLVRTNFDDGLQREHVERAITHLAAELDRLRSGGGA